MPGSAVQVRPQLPRPSLSNKISILFTPPPLGGVNLFPACSWMLRGVGTGGGIRESARAPRRGIGAKREGHANVNRRAARHRPIASSCRERRIPPARKHESDSVGLVADDLWMPAALKVLKSAPKPVVSTDAPPIPIRPQTQLADAEQALAEAATGEEAAAPAPQPAPGGCCPEAGTPAGQPAPDTRNLRHDHRPAGRR